MIRLPSLPFASSIAAGEHHAGLTSDNDAIFNLEYFVGLHKIHHDDIPQVLTEKLAQELMECAHNMHKDLTSVLLEHMQEGVELILKEMIQKYSVYCIRSRKRLRFSSTNGRVTRPSMS